MGTYTDMTARDVVVYPLVRAMIAASIAGAAILVSPGISAVAAAPCPDVEVVFARGTGEPPGVGPTGQAFVDALSARVGGVPLAVYAVDYPATDHWDTGVDGIRDAGAHVVSRASECPKTQMVLGGYSQGAAVMGFVTSAQVPDDVDPATVPKPLEPAVADHVAAVVLFAMPNARAMNFLNQPRIVIGPLYQTKTVQLCAPEDAVCSDGVDFAAHDSYAADETMVDQASAFAAGHLQGRG